MNCAHLNLLVYSSSDDVHGRTQPSGKGGSNFVNIGDLTFYNGGGGGRCSRQLK